VTKVILFRIESTFLPGSIGEVAIPSPNLLVTPEWL
jgi:hypothetical protein